VSKVYYALELQGPAIAASAPLRREDGQLLGVLVGRLNLEELNTIIQRRSGLRQTDDAFLVNASNLFVTQPYLLPDPAVLQRGIYTEAVMRCLQTGASGTLSTIDYREIPSIITYRWLPEHELCLIVKMNRDEALAPIYAFGRTIVWIALATLTTASGLGLILSRSMIRPILEIQTVVQRYGRGDMDVRLPETRSDELGVLAREFNQMASALEEKEKQLRDYATQLEQKVEERTAELRQSEERFSKAFYQSPIGIALIDLTDDTIRDVNNALLQMIGLSRERVVGQNVRKFNIQVDPEMHAQMTQERKEQSDNRQGKLVLPSGEVREVLASTALINISEEPHALALYQDITERKQAEEKVQRSEAMLRAVLDQMPSGVTVRDGQSGALLLSNARSREIMGALVDTANQFAQYRGFHPDGRPYQAEDWPLSRSMATGEVVHTEEVVYERNDGTHITLSINSAPVRDLQGQIVMAVGVFDDITERKHAEEELRRTLEELKFSNAELEQFAYVASHDLQEPLRMVSSYMQLLARRYQGKLDQDADEFIAFAVDGAKRMQNLINDLLTFSRVGTRGKALISTSAEDALEEAMSNLQIAIEESRASITHAALPQVKGDPTQLVQLFQNLLSNAIKFRGLEPPRIHVGVRQEGDEWIVSVCDNGIGIDAKFADRIFVIFQRLHDRNSYPGTGIGLAICKRIIQRHGGRIWVESEPGQGATFYFTLPNKETL
jgi:PAS domain S-box-containing protein